MSKSTNSSEMLAEYDFSGGVRGKHLEEYRRGTNLVAIDEDLLKVFPDSESVNEALRTVLKTSKKPRS